MIQFLTKIFADYRAGTIASITTTGAAQASELLIKQNWISTMFQHTAWTIGIIAGLVAIINGVDTFIRNRRRYKYTPKTRYTDAT